MIERALVGILWVWLIAASIVLTATVITFFTYDRAEGPNPWFLLAILLTVVGAVVGITT